MLTNEYHLYRIKFVKPAQATLFPMDISPSEMFCNAIKECPRLEKGKGVVWHIGNVEFINKTDGVFAIGKTTKRTIEKYNETTKSFFLSEDESSPYTFIAFDSSRGILGVCKKTQLAANTKAIASQLKNIIVNTEFIRNHPITVHVSHIPDPTDFIEKIRSAYSITRFYSSFTGPNPIDADEVFQKPLSFFCQTIGGEQGSVSITGKALDEGAVESVARASAATGNDVHAKIRPLQTSKPLPVSFRGDPTRLIVNGDATTAEIIESIKSEYQRVRG